MNTTSKTATASQQQIYRDLAKERKSISSMYFYDDVGSRLFEDIMNLDEYYLTRCESEIFERHGLNMAQKFSNGGKRFFNLVELGAGDGIKTKILLNELCAIDARFLYSPIDISGEALRELKDNIGDLLPVDQLNSLQGDYFKMLSQIGQMNHGPKVILFLGSSIGNYHMSEAISFLRQIRNVMIQDDRLMVGFDLVKESETILNAYNDKQGITATFNYNLLHRINTELGANFNVSTFEHAPIYDPIDQVAKSYLVSKREQNVYFDLFEEEVHFAKWEPIFTESSYKYTEKSINEIANAAGFKVDEWFLDSKQWFADVVLKPM